MPELSDDQLLALLEQKRPEELTAEELASLRARLPESPPLQERLLGQVQMEQYLAAVLGKPDISAESVAAQAPQVAATAGAAVGSAPEPAAARRRWPVALLGALLAALVGFAVMRSVLPPRGAVEADRPLAAREEGDERGAAGDEAAVTDAAAGDEAPVDVGATEEEASTGEAGEAPPADGSPADGADDAAPDDASPAGKAPDASRGGGESPTGAAPAAAPAPPAGPPARPAGPWDGPDQLGGAAVPFADVAFSDFVSGRDYTGQRELRTWLAGVRGQQADIREQGRPAIGHVGGVFHVRPLAGHAWPEKGVLRLSLGQRDWLRIHCFHGDRGATLAAHESRRTHSGWIGYQTTRAPGQPLPETYALTSSDHGRGWRTGARGYVTLDLRYHDGAMILSRGATRLLTVPLPGPPDDVLLEGKALIRGMRLFRSGPPPAPPEVTAHDVTWPAPKAWRRQLPEGARLERLPRGGARLATTATGETAWAAVSLSEKGAMPDDGPREVILQVRGATPGTAVYLGDAEGKPLYPLQFYQLLEKKTPRGLAIFPGPLNPSTERRLTPRPEAIPHVGSDVWLRLVFSGAHLKCWAGVDGRHWGQIATPHHFDARQWQSVGIAAVAGDARSIALETLRVRTPDTLATLIPDDLRRRAPLPTERRALGPWLDEVAGREPPGVDPGDWRLAAAWKTLGASPHPELARHLWSAFYRAAADAEVPLATRRAMFRELADLGDAWHGAGGSLPALDVVAAYRRAARRQLESGSLRPYSEFGRALIDDPLWTTDDISANVEPPLAREEMLALASAGRWDELQILCDELQLYDPPALRTQLQWGRAVAARAPTGKSRRKMPPLDRAARHPLHLQVSKEGFNVLAELEAALAGEAYADACQIVSSAPVDELPGLLPDGNDSRLSVSLTVALASAMRRHPPLIEAMQQLHGPSGALRVRAAASAGDFAALERATVQLLGTEAAAEAHLHLADRALAAGDLVRADVHYRAARQRIPATLRPQLDARRRLAAAVAGRAIGAPVATTVRLGDVELAPAAFERIVAAALKRAGGTPDRPGDDARSVPRGASGAPLPGRFDVEKRGRFDGHSGRHPEQVPGHYGQHQIDWVARQLATTVAEKTLYVSNRFSVAAFDLADDGKRRWQEPLLGDKVNTHAGPAVPLAPVLHDGRLLVRGAAPEGQSLVALDADDGKLLWKLPPRRERSIVADPLPLPGRLLLLAAERIDRYYHLQLLTCDAEHGTILATAPLLQLGESWQGHRTAAAARAGDSLVAAVGGSVLAVDLDGRVRWVRRQTWLGPPQMPDWIRCEARPPLVADGRVYVAQPGVPLLECLDVTSGRLHFSRLLTELRGVVGLVDGRLIVEVDDGLLALDADDGRTLWRHRDPRALAARLCGPPGGLLYARRRPAAAADKFQPELVWLDVANGEPVATTTLDTPAEAEPLLGPLVRDGETVWAFFGRGLREPHRDLLQLRPAGDAQRLSAAPAADEGWRPHLEPRLVAAARQLLPAWTLLEGRLESRDKRPHLAEFRGRDDALLLRAPRGGAARLARRITTAAGSRPRLRLEVACAEKGACHLEVVAGGKTLWEERFSDEKTKEGWRQAEIDLAPVAGRTAWVVVRQYPAGEKGQHDAAYWRRLEVVQ